MITAGQKKIMKQIIEAIDPHKKSSCWKVIEGNLLEMYSSFTFLISFESQWSIWTIEYEKKTEDTPEPLNFVGLILDVTKHIDDHLLKQ